MSLFIKKGVNMETKIKPQELWTTDQLIKVLDLHFAFLLLVKDGNKTMQELHLEFIKKLKEGQK